MGRYERTSAPKKKLRGLVIGLAAVFLLAACWGGYELWHYQQPKFHDVTIELGTESVSMGDFLTEYARPRRVSFVSDISQVDLNRVGTYDLTLRHGRQEQTVRLTIQDTTAPQVQFVKSRTELASYEPKAEDFVKSVQDLSSTRVFFEEDVAVPPDYGDTAVTVVVADEQGNETRQDCTISWVWMVDSYNMELGHKLTKDDLLIVPERDGHLLKQEELDKLNSEQPGEFTIISATNAKSLTCAITIQDTQGPVLKLKNGKCKPGGTVTVEDFVSSAEDASGQVELRLLTVVDTSTEGRYEVQIEAKDRTGNISTGETMLYVTTDMEPPVISGAEEMLEVAKGSTPDYLAGVSAQDKETGVEELTCESSVVDTSKSGTYIVTYKATDMAGNVTTFKRTVLVLPDQADVDAMVAAIGAELPADPERLRNYVRDKFGYNSNWGGSMPVWYGFSNMNGNCYVHAMCLKALYDLKGIESQLIWTTDKSHYWLQVNIDGRWLHIDPTPGPGHSKYSLMTDNMRLSTLDGRTWERDKWPACK